MKDDEYLDSPLTLNSTGMPLSQGSNFNSRGWLEYKADFESWEPDNKHWVAPSVLEIWSDGTIRFAARELSNMNRHPGPIDGGPDFSFSLSLDLKGYQGEVVHRLGLRLGTLGYRVKWENFDCTWPPTERLADMLLDAKSVIVTRRITRDWTPGAIYIGTGSTEMNPNGPTDPGQYAPIYTFP